MSQQINLFNPVFLKTKKHFSALTMAQGLAMILLGAVAMTIFVRFELAGIADQAAFTSKQLKSTQAQLAKVSAEYGPRQKSKQLEDDILRAEAELKSQAEVLDLMRRGGVGSTTGYSEYLRAFSRQIVAGLWLTGFRISDSGSEIELRGRALQPELVAVYVNRLRQEPVMRGKTFAALDMQVPDVDVSVRDAGGTVSTKRVAAEYIEFVLRSSLADAEGGQKAVAAERPGVIQEMLKLQGGQQ